jgi:hypothetical protein
MNYQTAPSETKEAADRSSEADQAPQANQAFFVVATPPRAAEPRPGNKTKFLYDAVRIGQGASEHRQDYLRRDP